MTVEFILALIALGFSVFNTWQIVYVWRCINAQGESIQSIIDIAREDRRFGAERRMDQLGMIQQVATAHTALVDALKLPFELPKPLRNTTPGKPH